jgi:methionyl-tRNA formyltransferase
MPAFWTFHKKMGRGVTLFRLDEGIDTGEIIYQIPINNPSDSYMGFLFQTKVIGVDLLVAWVMENLVNFKIPAKVPSSYNKYPAVKYALGIK